MDSTADGWKSLLKFGERDGRRVESFGGKEVSVNDVSNRHEIE